MSHEFEVVLEKRVSWKKILVQLIELSVKIWW
jgi:hypothetical protein